MNVLEVFEVLTDHKQMEWHVVKDSKLLHLIFLVGGKDREAERDFLGALMLSDSSPCELCTHPTLAAPP